MGDVDGRRGAAEGIVTVRATRQLTERRTWGTGEGEGTLSEHAASGHKRRQMQGSGTPAAYWRGPGLTSPSDWTPANPTHQAVRSFLSKSGKCRNGTQIRSLPFTSLTFEATQSALMTSLNKP